MGDLTGQGRARKYISFVRHYYPGSYWWAPENTQLDVVVLAPEAYTAWMATGKGGAESLLDILSSGAVTDFTFYPVSKQVNSVGNNEPGNIEPVELV